MGEDILKDRQKIGLGWSFLVYRILSALSSRWLEVHCDLLRNRILIADSAMQPAHLTRDILRHQTAYSIRGK
jgi:hypothetical protein